MCFFVKKQDRTYVYEPMLNLQASMRHHYRGGTPATTCVRHVVEVARGASAMTMTHGGWMLAGVPIEASSRR